MGKTAHNSSQGGKKDETKREKSLGALLLALLLGAYPSAAHSAVAWGDRGSDVKAVQQRLRQYGYMTAPADGIYGQATYEAVVWFQRKNGLTADGVVGPATAAAGDHPAGRQRGKRQLS